MYMSQHVSLNTFCTQFFKWNLFRRSVVVTKRTLTKDSSTIDASFKIRKTQSLIIKRKSVKTQLG